MTSGGTESILLAVKAARERGRKRARHHAARTWCCRPAAHAAFEKGCYYFGVGESPRSRRRGLARRRRGDGGGDRRQHGACSSARRRSTRRASSIRSTEIAALAEARNINCHVDACMGGVVADLPGPARRADPAVELRRAGRHEHLGRSAQVRLHRQGRLGDHAPHQAAAQLPDLRHRQLARRPLRLVGRARHQGWRLDGRSVGRHASPRQRRIPPRHRSSTASLPAAGRGDRRPSPNSSIRAQPQATLLAFGAADETGLDIFAVADALWRRGWYVDRQGPPPSLHCTVSVVHDGKIDAFVSDLRASIDEARAIAPRGDLQGTYGTID